MNPDPNQPQDQPTSGASTETPAVAPETPPSTESTPPVVPQPEPTPAPEPPVPPFNASANGAASPFGPAPAAGGVPTPPAGKPSKFAFMNGPKRKLFIILAIVIGAIVVLGIAALITVAALFPTKADYRNAYSQYSSVNSAGSKVISDVTSLEYDTSESTTDTQFTNDTDAYKKDLQSFKEESDKLANMKAVKTGDGAKYFNAYNDKVGSLISYGDDLVTSIQSYRPLVKACGSDATTLDLMKECLNKVNNVGDLPNADVKKYVETAKPLIQQAVDVLTKVKAITDPYGDQYDQYSSLRDQAYDIEDKLSAALRDLNSNLQKHFDDMNPSKAADTLGDYLYDKSK